MKIMLFDIFKKREKQYQDLNADAFYEAVKSKDAMVIDVRSAGELSSGKIKNARNINIMSSEFAKQIQNLPKDKAYYLYCRSGSRSANAATIMAKEGFTKVYNLQGGLMSWPFDTH